MKNLLENLWNDYNIYIIGLVILAIAGAVIYGKIQKTRLQKFEADPDSRVRQLDKKINSEYKEYDRLENSAARENDDAKRREVEAKARKQKAKIDRLERERDNYAKKSGY